MKKRNRTPGSAPKRRKLDGGFVYDASKLELRWLDDAEPAFWSKGRWEPDRQLTIHGVAATSNKRKRSKYWGEKLDPRFSELPPPSEWEEGTEEIEVVEEKAAARKQTAAGRERMDETEKAVIRGIPVPEARGGAIGHGGTRFMPSAVRNDRVDRPQAEAAVPQAEGTASDSWQLTDESVEGRHLAEVSVNTRHLADGAVTGDKIEPGSVWEEHIANGAILQHHVSDQAIGEEHLQEDAVATVNLQDEAVTAEKLAPRSVTSRKMAPKAVGPEHLQPQAVRQEHLVPGAVQENHLADRSVSQRTLAFQPVVGHPSLPQAMQQFGHSRFEFGVMEEASEVSVDFPISFMDDEYAFVAMTDHPACYVTLKSKSENAAVVTIIRSKYCPAPVGTLTWIAIGHTGYSNP